MKVFKKIEKSWRSVGQKLGHNKVRKALHLRGKNFQSLLGAFRPSNSAGSVASSSDTYGPTGTIVGRF